MTKPARQRDFLDEIVDELASGIESFRYSSRLRFVVARTSMSSHSDATGGGSRKHGMANRVHRKSPVTRAFSVAGL